MNNNNYVAIMAGGIGSRFWPVSRTNYPKQFLDILNTGRTLLQSTYDRYLSFIPNENIYIITSEGYVNIVRTQLPNLRIENIIGEPERKNTAPCIAYISMKLHKINPLANLIVAPSDHLIQNQEKFEQSCNKALAHTARSNEFVTLGIKPTYANTGYGYIQQCNSSNQSIKEVIRFTEKPDLETAIKFYKEGNYLWNSGIFIWKAIDILNAFEQFMPSMFELFNENTHHLNTLSEKDNIKVAYKNCESISIDYAILEKANNVRVIEAEFKWSDLGTWNSAWENSAKDIKSNATSGENTLLVDANGCIVHSTGKKLVLLGGVEDLIVVDTEDALMICKKENEQKIKEYLQKVKESKGESYL